MYNYQLLSLRDFLQLASVSQLWSGLYIQKNLKTNPLICTGDESCCSTLNSGVNSMLPFEVLCST